MSLHEDIKKKFSAIFRNTNMDKTFCHYIGEYFESPSLQYDPSLHLYSGMRFNENLLLYYKFQLERVTGIPILHRFDHVWLEGNSESPIILNTIGQLVYNQDALSNHSINEVYLALYNDCIRSIQYCYSSFRKLLYSALQLDESLYSISFYKVFNECHNLITLARNEELIPFNMDRYFYTPFIALGYNLKSDSCKSANFGTSSYEGITSSCDLGKYLPISKSANKLTKHFAENLIDYRTLIIPERRQVSFNYIDPDIKDSTDPDLYKVQEQIVNDAFSHDGMTICDPNIRDRSINPELVSIVNPFIHSFVSFYNLLNGLTVAIQDNQSKKLVAVVDISDLQMKSMKWVKDYTMFAPCVRFKRKVNSKGLMFPTLQEQDEYNQTLADRRTFHWNHYLDRQGKIQKLRYYISEDYFKSQLLSIIDPLYTQTKQHEDPILWICLTNSKLFHSVPFEGELDFLIRMPIWSSLYAVRRCDRRNPNQPRVYDALHCCIDSQHKKTIQINTSWICDELASQVKDVKLKQQLVKFKKDLECQIPSKLFITYNQSPHLQFLYEEHHEVHKLLKALDGFVLDDVLKSFQDKLNEVYDPVAETHYQSQMNTYNSKINAFKKKYSFRLDEVKPIQEYSSIEDALSELNFYYNFNENNCTITMGAILLNY